jgi:hypothetical protein
MKTRFALANNQFSFKGAPSKTKFLSLVHATRRRWIIRTAAGFLALLFIGNLQAQPLSVAVSSAQYTTYVEAEGTPTSIYPPVSRTTVSAFPISDQIAMPLTEGFGAGGTNYAIANAGVFGVSDRTGWGVANASATSQLWFSPTADQTQTIGIQVYAIGASQPLRFTGGQISLLDLTSGSEVWNYYWSVLVSPNAGSGNVPWDLTDQSTANFSVDTGFLASHQYELTMMVNSSAGDDTEIAQIQLAGLQAVPEPSSVCLILPALAGLFAARRSTRC